ncbi:sigma-70 family RNA polymerase sigma factor [Leptospira gomenensis]|uniref:Sigma-70 family RNA polymerase sigma factor n=1 Tax=Leptospira gomenensis TaxID=2484974 RepID=A0A5F1YAN2_9LEPT|nr:sigma-70 family RNA polymerase sigma factor [Leptospira gomenensis]TGK34452.1 sigma-70 family RNA polymerase sigma factor [Leptospira gomenensis]TGK41838.1 sigma-70 family RNA polymerase sigma factor [Leptospira gomenensis]TGK44775.1 sigma-70 family RNA polymerase sigma factor [Leptospira gomenensis]TGK65162.1 sigma-70 family RNA polymerase sigma factor [Leptospira gomenensis]
MSDTLEEVERLYKSYYNKLKFFFLKSGLTNESAEELCQETFIKIYKHHQKYDPNKGSENTWVYAIAKNELIDFYRRNKNEKTIIDWEKWENLTFSSGSSQNDAEEKMLMEQLNKSIHQLKEPEKSIVVLHCIHGKSIAETSEQTGIAQRTVSRRLVSAFKLLKDELKMSGIDGSWLQGVQE